MIINLDCAVGYVRALNRLRDALNAATDYQSECATITIAGTLSQVMVSHNSDIMEMARRWNKVDSAETNAVRWASSFYGESVNSDRVYTDMCERIINL